MDKDFDVMLAEDVNEKDIKYPTIGSPKIDGWRYTIRHGTGYTRSGESVPNRATQSFFSHQALADLDGELVVGPANVWDTFHTTSSGLGTERFDPRAVFLVFDMIGLKAPFSERLVRLKQVVDTLPLQFQGRVHTVAQVPLANAEELRLFEDISIDSGFEGLILRSPNGYYKHGRSTVEEQGMLKLKRFQDAEAIVLGMEEETDDSKRPKGTMGALKCADLKTHVKFKIGTGFTKKQRDQWWTRRNQCVGVYVKYKFFPRGTKNSPRSPVFVGERARQDMDRSPA